MATRVLFYDANKTNDIENACNTKIILGNGLRCDVVHKIPAFFFLHDRALSTSAVLL